jgi:hypothetical protein
MIKQILKEDTFTATATNPKALTSKKIMGPINPNKALS